jgi:uncharacterized protein
MEDPVQIHILVVALGLLLGALFGAVVRKTNFCAMGAVSDVVSMAHWNRMRMWLLAIAVAIAGTAALSAAGAIDPARTLYATARFTWLSYIVGGFLFGVGMTLASGCGSKNLVRLGAGNLKALVVVFLLGITAYMSIKGALAPLRVGLLDGVALQLQSGQTLPQLLSRGFGWTPGLSTALVAFAFVLALLAFVAIDRDFRRDRDGWIGGVSIGLVIVAGWYVTGTIGYLAEHPDTLEEAFIATNSRRPESLSFVGPVAYTLELGLLWTDASLRVTFGIAIVLGTVLGAFLHAWATRGFRWEGFSSAGDMRRHLLGAVLMGFGGVTAVGCTIGQGISGLSVLALGSMLAFASIVAGSALTLKWLYWQMQRET